MEKKGFQWRGCGSRGCSRLAGFHHTYKRSDFGAGGVHFSMCKYVQHIHSAIGEILFKSQWFQHLPMADMSLCVWVCVCVCGVCLPKPLRAAFSLTAYRETEWGRHRWVNLLKVTGVCMWLHAHTASRAHMRSWTHTWNNAHLDTQREPAGPSAETLSHMNNQGFFSALHHWLFNTWRTTLYCMCMCVCGCVYVLLYVSVLVKLSWAETWQKDREDTWWTKQIH